MRRSRLFQSTDSTSSDNLEQDMSESNEENPIQALIKNLDIMRELIEQIDLGENDPDFSDKSPEEIRIILSDMEKEFKQRIEDNQKVNGETIPHDLAVFVEKNRRILASARQEIESRGYMDDSQPSTPKLK